MLQASKGKGGKKWYVSYKTKRKGGTCFDTVKGGGKKQERKKGRGGRDGASTGFTCHLESRVDKEKAPQDKRVIVI